MRFSGPSQAVRGALLAMLACWLAIAPRLSEAADPAPASDEIVLEALALLGVPYRWGGTDPARGLDCSGLIRHVFKTVAALDLPRRSEEMSRLGKKVGRADLRAGDLLFFNTLGHPNSHVALYLGDGRFVHAPGRKSQVRVDGLDERYWRARFNGARRIELGQTTPAAVPAAEPEHAETHLGARSSDDVPNGP